MDRAHLAEDRRPKPADRSRLRRFGRLLIHRGERATRDGDFAGAAIEFEQAAWAYKISGDALPAAEATLELGRCLLYLDYAERLPVFAGRIENLAREEAKNLPEGGLITLRVWAALLRKGAAEPRPLLQLIRSRRRARQRAVCPDRRAARREAAGRVVSGAREGEAL